MRWWWSTPSSESRVSCKAPQLADASYRTRALVGETRAKFARPSGSKHHGNRIVRSGLFMMLLAGLAFGCGSGEKPNPRDAADANDTGATLPARSPSEQSILQQVAG